ncbi:10522_t:CDS:2, partial [Funneliformis mosseae]
MTENLKIAKDAIITGHGSTAAGSVGTVASEIEEVLEKDSSVTGSSVYRTNEVMTEVITEARTEVIEDTQRREKRKPSYLRGTKDVVMGSIKQGFGKVFGNDEMEGTGKNQKDSGKEEV